MKVGKRRLFKSRPAYRIGQEFVEIERLYGELDEMKVDDEGQKSRTERAMA